MSRFVVCFMKDVLGKRPRARGLPELYRDRRRRRGAGHRDSQAKILRIAVSARLVTTCRPDQDLDGRFSILKASYRQ